MQNFRTGNDTKASNTEAVPWGYRPTSGLAHKPWAHFTAAAEFNYAEVIRNCNVHSFFSVPLED